MNKNDLEIINNAKDIMNEYRNDYLISQIYSYGAADEMTPISILSIFGYVIIWLSIISWLHYVPMTGLIISTVIYLPLLVGRIFVEIKQHNKKIKDEVKFLHSIERQSFEEF